MKNQIHLTQQPIKYSSFFSIVPTFIPSFGLLTLSLVLLNIHGALSQSNLHFEHIPPEAGLTDIRIHSIFQDSKGIMWFAGDSGLNRYDGREIKTFAYPKNESLEYLPGNWHIEEDEQERLWVFGWNKLSIFNSQKECFEIIKEVQKEGIIGIQMPAKNIAGNIWTGSLHEGLMRFDSQKKQFLPSFPNFNQKNNPKLINPHLKDSYGDLWFSSESGIYQVNSEDSSIVYHPFGDDIDRSVSDRIVSVVFEDSHRNLWLGTRDGLGLFLFDRTVNKFIPYPLTDPKIRIITALCEAPSGNLWIGSNHEGLFELNIQTEQLLNHTYSRNNKATLKSNRIKDIYRDPQGDMWIGTWDAGVFRWNSNRKAFTTWQFEPREVNGDMPLTFFDRKTEKIWLAYGNEINLFNPLKLPSISQAFPTFIVAEDKEGQIWYGNWGRGLFRYDPSSNKKVHYKGDPNRKGSLPGPSVNQVYVDRQGTVWVGVFKSGLFRFNPNQETFDYHHLEHPKTSVVGVIMAIHEDQKGNLWIGTNGQSGLIRLNKNRTIEKVYDIPECNHIHEDKKGHLWLASMEGFYQLNPDNGVIKVWETKEGLPHNTVFCIEEDDKGRFWLGTKMGLSRFNPTTETFKNYTTSDGLPSQLFETKSAQKTTSGEFYFLNQNQVFHFHPDSIRDNPNIPSILLTDFQIHNKKVPIKGSLGDTLEHPSPLLQAISYTKKIQLNWQQNDISFAFSALNYAHPEENQYKYRLENYDDNWTSTTAQRPFATYTNLNPGSYTFRVIGSNNDGVWNEEGTAVQIIISPPWWQTWWAYSLYVLFGLSLLYGLYRFLLNRRLEKAETYRLRELDMVKSRLYTNITHEFRTPLTVMLGMTDVWESKMDPQKLEEVNQPIKMIRRNGENLLALVNQMLDLAKLESGNLKLELIQRDVIPFVKYLCESFQSLAEEKQVNLVVYDEINQLFMDLDTKKLTGIISNLLSNAVKFTSNGGKIIVHLNQIQQKEKPYFVIKIQDNGIGIAETELANIFNRFYQADGSATRKGEGTGIGLALTKELVELMQGVIEVKSKLGTGSEFKLLLPITRDAIIREEITRNSPKTKKGHTVSEPTIFSTPSTKIIESPPLEEDLDLPIALIIEDNTDVVHYLKACLADDYQTIHAANGKIGVEMACEKIPDVIICDVMMPEMDGFEVCAILKTDERTDHIPIIILTAKATMADRLTGLSQGADAYLSKPFEKEELLIRTHQLLAIRKTLQQKYSKQLVTGLNTQQTPISESDHFIRKLENIILENMESEDFSVHALARFLHLSRSQAHRKIKALTGMSASIYIRLVRLQKAKELLQNDALSISEIAYQVGFKTPVYFSQVYKETYGESPSAIRK